MHVLKGADKVWHSSFFSTNGWKKTQVHTQKKRNISEHLTSTYSHRAESWWPHEPVCPHPALVLSRSNEQNTNLATKVPVSALDCNDFRKSRDLFFFSPQINAALLRCITQVPLIAKRLAKPKKTTRTKQEKEKQNKHVLVINNDHNIGKKHY